MDVKYSIKIKKYFFHFWNGRLTIRWEAVEYIYEGKFHTGLVGSPCSVMARVPCRGYEGITQCGLRYMQMQMAYVGLHIN